MSKNAPDVWFKFIQSHRWMIREIDRRLHAENLPNYAWYDVLWGLESGTDHRRRMHELADTLAIERYNLTRVVARLEAEGLVSRSRSEEDGRATYVSITREGQSLRRKMWKVYQGAVADLFLSQFEQDQRSTVADSLDKVIQAARDSYMDGGH
ncbi:MarR family winged helix-turn-helix transcriptional regulator [Pollutimonas thiosulfatoxidans]|uniref:MarR family transcriptional regulator n=1 Tax=Pollutimonas thiosulfatoxidans TaxID=2028345 RepID=A0A410GGG1_9BURK|nr:MarR family transcriptional regulator [Pollutimonas thiosulfatoxidans]MBF6618172.1 MarR family transcriptional regulator [Candidimonas sp.]QAA95345.1 MarR family transcriptional regulator [Pollutimonas thiosulfatoxidans]